MFFAPLLALGLSSVALAQNNTAIPNVAPPMVTPPPTTLNPSNGFPARVGDYQFYGCVGSSKNFPSFEKIGTNPQMDLELCAASCGSRFFGIAGT
jgi:hypothetical protein